MNVYRVIEVIGTSGTLRKESTTEAPRQRPLFGKIARAARHCTAGGPSRLQGIRR